MRPNPKVLGENANVSDRHGGVVEHPIPPEMIAAMATTVRARPGRLGGHSVPQRFP